MAARGAVIDYLKYIVGIDTATLQKDARKADNIVQNSANSMKRAMVGAAAAIGASFGVYKFVEFVKGATMAAARLEELDVVLRVVGDSAGYSYGYLKKQEEKIKDVGIQTDSAITLMLRFIQSQLDVADAIKVAIAAKDLAIIGEQNTSQAAETLTYAIAAQRPILLRQFGIVTDLSEVFSKHAKVLGKTAENLTEVEKRTAMLNVVLENAKRVEGAYEAAMTTAGKQLRSMPRYVYEASKAIGQEFLPTLTEAVFDISKLIKAIGESDEHGVRKAFKRLGALSLDLYGKMKDLLSFLNKYLPNIISSLKALVAIPLALWIRKVAASLIALSTKNIYGLIATIGILVAGWTGALDEIFKRTEKFMGGLIGLGGKLATEEEKLQRVVQVLKELIELRWVDPGHEIDEFRTAFEGLVKEFTELTGKELPKGLISVEYLEGLVQEYEKKLVEMAKVIETETIKSEAKTTKVIEEAWRKRLLIAKSFSQKYIAQQKQMTIELVKLTKKEYIDKVMELVFKLNDELNEALKNTLDESARKWQEWAYTIEYILVGIADRISRKFGDLVSGIGSAIRGIKAGGAGMVGGIATGIFAIFDFFTSSTERAAKASYDFAEALKRAKESVEDIFLGLGVRALKYFKDLETLMRDWEITIQEGELVSRLGELPAGIEQSVVNLLKQLERLGYEFEDLNLETLQAIIAQIKWERDVLEKFVLTAETIPQMIEALGLQTELTFGEGQRLIDYWAKKHNLTLEDQKHLFEVLEDILIKTGYWTEEARMELEETIRDLIDQIAEDIAAREKALAEQRRAWLETIKSFTLGIDQFTRTQKQAMVDALDRVIAQIKNLTQASWYESLQKAIENMVNWMMKGKGSLLNIMAQMSNVAKLLPENLVYIVKEIWTKLAEYQFKGGPAPTITDIVKLINILKEGMGELSDAMKKMLKNMLEAAGLPITFELENLLKMLGILEGDIEDFGKLMSADTMKEFFEMLKKEAVDSFNRGRELIDYWTEMYDLTVEDQLKLYRNLKDLLIASGGWSEADLMSLNLILKRLEDQVTGAGGMTQVYRSVTAITERQGNLMLSALNSLNNYVRQILEQIKGVVNGNGIPSITGPRPVVQIGPIYTNDAGSLLNQLEKELRGRGYQL